VNRRNFLRFAGVLLPGLALVGCGKSSDGPAIEAAPEPTPNDPPAADLMCTGDGAVTYTNPGHAHTTSALTMAEIDAAVPGDYNLMGGGHSHMVTVTAQNFTDLQNGMALNLVSDSHGHMVTIQCPTA